MPAGKFEALAVVVIMCDRIFRSSLSDVLYFYCVSIHPSRVSCQFQIIMSGVVGKAIKTFKDNSLGFTMVGLLVGAHIGWRWLQDQEEFVPKGTAKEYPWIEASRHYQKAKAAQSTEAQEKS